MFRQDDDPLTSKTLSDSISMSGLLVRDDKRSDCIRGSFYLGGSHFQILEPPWRNNARNESCIPTGTYEAHFLLRSASGKYRNVFWLKDVPGRDGILIHNGNIVDHTRGCLIIGKRRSLLAGKSAVLNSRTALHELAALTQHRNFHITIIGGQN